MGVETDFGLDFRCGIADRRSVKKISKSDYRFSKIDFRCCRSFLQIGDSTSEIRNLAAHRVLFCNGYHFPSGLGIIRCIKQEAQ